MIGLKFDFKNTTVLLMQCLQTHYGLKGTSTTARHSVDNINRPTQNEGQVYQYVWVVLFLTLLRFVTVIGEIDFYVQICFLSGWECGNIPP